MYIQPTANVTTASAKILEITQQFETQSPDSVKLITGDFNSCDLKTVLPHCHQYVDIHTRGNRTLDKCYGNIKKAYKAHSKAGLGSSDHDVVHLVPVYIQKLKQEKPQVKQVRKWSTDGEEALRACFDCTDWSIFTKLTTIDMATDVVTDYIKFCEDMIIPKKGN